MVPRPRINVLAVSRLPIYTQLCLEEALLRATKDNWLIVNDGAFSPAIVLGISGKPSELVDVPAALAANVPAIKRFTGGGTVIVDRDTVFASLIVQGSSLPSVECFPQPVMQWTERFYGHVFPGAAFPGFRLRENDYVFGERKFGGNAQAITGKRWLHHTSLLWDFDPSNMRLLKHPAKAPVYREGRGHEEFVVRLQEHYGPGRKHLVQAIVEAAGREFEPVERGLADVSAVLQQRPMINSKLLDLRLHLQQQQQ